MAISHTEGVHPLEFIISEANGLRSRKVETVAAGADLQPNTVVGKVTASGKVVQLAPGASDGSEAAYGVLMYPAKAASADAKVTAVVRDAEVKDHLVIWPDGITAGEKATATADLETRGVIVRANEG